MAIELSPELTNIIIGFASSGVGVYVGLRVGLTKLELNFKHLQERIDERMKDQKDAAAERFDRVDERVEVIGKRTHNLNDDSLIHDIEIEDLCRKAQIPRKKRQNWRLDW